MGGNGGGGAEPPLGICVQHLSEGERRTVDKSDMGLSVSFSLNDVQLIDEQWLNHSDVTYLRSELKSATANGTWGFPGFAVVLMTLGLDGSTF